MTSLVGGRNDNKGRWLEHDLAIERLTESGLSLGLTLAPSNKKRTEDAALPWRSQKAFMSLERAVVRLILKKTSLLLSVTLMLRCSDRGWSSGLPPAPGDCSWSDMVIEVGVVDRFGYGSCWWVRDIWEDAFVGGLCHWRLQKFSIASSMPDERGDFVVEGALYFVTERFPAASGVNVRIL